MRGLEPGLPLPLSNSHDDPQCPLVIFEAMAGQLTKTCGHRRAVVAVARKLAVILHLIWLDDQLVRWGAEATAS